MTQTKSPSLTKTPIEWCYNGTSHGYSWNFVTGCTKISAGCANCYAADIAHRFWGNRPFSDVRFHEDRLTAPLKLTKPANVFVNSMSDVFHEHVSFAVVQDALRIMEATPQLHYILLTKRAARMQQFFNEYAQTSKGSWAYTPLQNVTIGVSVEDNRALDRIGHLQMTPAAQRFISFEPLLEEVNAMSQIRSMSNPIHHAVIGGESGRGARDNYLHWVSSLMWQCDELSIKVFVKQLGAKFYVERPSNETRQRYHTKSSKGGKPEEWPQVLRRRDLLLPPIVARAQAFALRDVKK